MAPSADSASLAQVTRPAEPPRPVIYQLLVRTFGNQNTLRKPGGTLAENGCGKFSDISVTALGSIREMGFTHLWLTGVIEQASATAYPSRPADGPEILKGKAGSPYAIKDYFDVCPDYADDLSRRLAEFQELVARCHLARLKVLIDFVPNHVARGYGSDVRPEHSFGHGDQQNVFFHRDNHFFYLGKNHPGGGPPLRLPCGAVFAIEQNFGRVTGNNAITWAPSVDDWYETVKLNYGHDFTTGRDTSHLPSPDAAPGNVPRTWRTMDQILSYWQDMGVDGFRADMAHLVPVEFWKWAVKRSRSRDPAVHFFAEAYADDPAKLTDGDVLAELLEAGFDGAYDHLTYKAIQGIYEQGKWANDIDQQIFCGARFHRCLRYLENHDEVRIANPQHWGGVGMNAGRPAAGVIFGMSRAALMLYAGQELGEPASGAEGFSGDDGRSSIFDYTSLPELQKWNNGSLSAEQVFLRNWYAELFTILQQPAFIHGEFYGLNSENRDHEAFGRLPGEAASGHWTYAFLRVDHSSQQVIFCLVNFHPSHTFHGLRVRIPGQAMDFIGKKSATAIAFTGIFGDSTRHSVTTTELEATGVEIGDLAPFAVCYYVLK